VETYKIQLSPTIELTIIALSERHFWRVHTLPPEGDVTEPPLPEGYNREQALEFVPAYKEKLNEYQYSINTQRLWRSVGAARLEAYENLPEAKQESTALEKICKRYSYPHPDKLDDPLAVGTTMMEIAYERGGSTLPLTEAYLWLKEKSGGIDHEKVLEILKSLRPDSQRDAAGESSADSVTSPEGGDGTADDTQQPAV